MLEIDEQQLMAGMPNSIWAGVKAIYEAALDCRYHDAGFQG
jgi:hypothetical protein